MTKYEQNVREIAQKMQQMATPENPVSYGDYMQSKIALRRCADVVRKVLANIYHEDEDMITSILIGMGLIPEPPKTNGQ